MVEQCTEQKWCKKRNRVDPDEIREIVLLTMTIRSNNKKGGDDRHLQKISVFLIKGREGLKNH